jgi:WD40 repeat protein
MRAGDQNRLGSLSQAIAGIVLHQDKVVFASFYGSIFVGSISRGDVRCAHPGNVRDDGTLVDFTGCDRWWVGLYAGISGHACHIWDAGTEELVFNGGDITDPDALRGWRMLTEQAERIGRVKLGGNGLLLLATRLKVEVLDLETLGIPFTDEEETDDGIIVESVDVNRDRFLAASNDGNARVRKIRALENVCAFPFDGLGGADDPSSGSNNNNNYRKILGTLNTWLAFICIDGVVHAWDADSGARLYRLVEQVGDVFDLVGDDEHVAVCAVDNGIHLWSFRP